MTTSVSKSTADYTRELVADARTRTGRFLTSHVVWEVFVVIGPGATNFAIAGDADEGTVLLSGGITLGALAVLVVGVFLSQILRAPVRLLRKRDDDRATERSTLERRIEHAEARVGELEERRPRIRFGEPYVREHVGVSMSDGAWIGYGSFVVVPIVNERPEGGKQGDDAVDLHATIRVESIEGAVLVSDVPARWVGTTQPPDMSVYSSTSTPELAEMTIRPNSRPQGLDTVMHFIGADACYVWNNDSMRSMNIFTPKDLDGCYKIEDDEFVVRVTVEGSNVSPLQAAFRVRRDVPVLLLQPIQASISSPDSSP